MAAGRPSRAASNTTMPMSVMSDHISRTQFPTPDASIVRQGATLRITSPMNTAPRATASGTVSKSAEVKAQIARAASPNQDTIRPVAITLMRYSMIGSVRSIVRLPRAIRSTR